MEVAAELTPWACDPRFSSELFRHVRVIHSCSSSSVREEEELVVPRAPWASSALGDPQWGTEHMGAFQLCSGGGGGHSGQSL